MCLNPSKILTVILFMSYQTLTIQRLVKATFHLSRDASKLGRLNIAILAVGTVDAGILHFSLPYSQGLCGKEGKPECLVCLAHSSIAKINRRLLMELLFFSSVARRCQSYQMAPEECWRLWGEWAGMTLNISKLIFIPLTLGWISRWPAKKDFSCSHFVITTESSTYATKNHTKGIMVLRK